MSNSSDAHATPESSSNTPAVTCAGGCQHANAGIWRAVIYTPVVLLIGGLVALAAFPNLAEFAAPLIPESASKPVYPFNGTGMSPGSHCCASQASRGSCCSQTAALVRSTQMADFSCCSTTSATVTDGASVTDAEMPLNAEFTIEAESADERVAADALAVANGTSSESASN